MKPTKHLFIFLMITFSTWMTHDSQANTAPSGTASKGYSVRGKVVDGQSKAAVEFASIALFRQADQTLLDGAISNERGLFKIEGLAPGEYFLRISFMGYAEVNTPVFKLNAEQTSHNVGMVTLESTTQNLEAVEIVAEKRIMEYALDKKVINVEKNIVNDGGSAVDVLSNAPSISVDADGNISLKGSTNVTILIDGRPSSLSGVSLDQLPAGSIENIEIISNPSSKYNPEGMSGIINIKTKKRVGGGLNGSVSVSASTNSRYNGSLNLNYGIGKVNIFANIGGNYFSRGMNGSNNTVSTVFNQALPYKYETQENIIRGNGYGGSGKLGIDYRINTKNTLTLTADYNYWASDRNSIMPSSYSYFTGSDEINQDLGALTPYQIVRSESRSKGSNPQTNFVLGYKKTFDKARQEFTVDASFSSYSGNDNGTLDRWTHLVGVDSTYVEQLTLGKSFTYIADAQINYLHPIRKEGKIEVGYQGKIRGNSSDQEQFLNGLPAYDYSNIFAYNEQVHGIYAMWGDIFGPWSFQVGGRLEYVRILGKTTVPEQSQNTDTSFTIPYMRFYPTVHISRKLGKKQELQLSYSRRVNRPRMWNLNPFVDLSNMPFSISYGNPNLIPEDVHSVELNHSVYFKKTSIYTSLYYRYIADVIRHYSFVDSSGIRVSTSQNMESGTNFGLDIVLEQEIFKWWRFNVNFSFYRNITNGGTLDASLNTEGYSYSARLNSNMNFKKNLAIQFSLNYRGPNYWGQMEMYPNFGAELSVRKGFFNNKLSVGLRLSDVFNTQGFNGMTTGLDFKTESVRKRYQSRGVFLTVSYKINEGQRSQRKVKRGIQIEGQTDTGGGEE